MTAGACGALGLAVVIALLACAGEAPAPDSARVAGSAAAPDNACGATPSADWTPANVGAATFVVNRATQGMHSRTRWALSPDSSAMLVVEDPTGVENEPIANGVMFASERTGRTWRMDSVWSVAPSPDWRSLAVGRAYVLRNGEADSIPIERWAAASASLLAVAGPQPALAAESLRAHAFEVSGMSYALGVAATFIVHTDRDTASFPASFVRIGGWSVAWSCASPTGAVVVTGDRPVRVEDNDPAVSVVPALEPEQVTWTEGPVLFNHVPLARDSGFRLVVRGRVIEQRGDSVAIRDGDVLRTVGPGIPLAATRGGRFILAVAPRARARAYDSPDQLVVYRVP